MNKTKLAETTPFYFHNYYIVKRNGVFEFLNDNLRKCKTFNTLNEAKKYAIKKTYKNRFWTVYFSGEELVRTYPPKIKGIK